MAADTAVTHHAMREIDTHAGVSIIEAVAE